MYTFDLVPTLHGVILLKGVSAGCGAKINYSTRLHSDGREITVFCLEKTTFLGLTTVSNEQQFKVYLINCSRYKLIF